MNCEEKMHYRLEELITRYPQLKPIAGDIQRAFDILLECARGGHTILVCGNGGNAADSDHMVGELMKSFIKKRHLEQDYKERLVALDPEYGRILADTMEGTIRSINLTTHSALTTAFANDRNPDLVFAQQVNGYGEKGDVLVAMSTSGNSRNVVMASIVAKAKGLSVISMTGAKPARLDGFSDVAIKVPETVTFKVQELDLPIYHCLCLMLEDVLWEE